MNTTHSAAFSSNGYRAETPCQMPNGKALTLCADSARRFRVTQGRYWITQSQAHGARLDLAGDLFLEPGDSLLVQAGQQIVVEAWPRGAAARDAAFSYEWAPLRHPVAEACSQTMSSSAQRAQAWNELRSGLAQCYQALGRLLAASAMPLRRLSR